MFHDPIVDLSDPGWCAWFVFCLVFFGPIFGTNQTNFMQIYGSPFVLKFSQQNRDSFIRNSCFHTHTQDGPLSEITPIHGLFLNGVHRFLFWPLFQWSYRTLLLTTFSGLTLLCFHRCDDPFPGHFFLPETLGGPKLPLWRCLWRRTGVKNSGRNGWKGSDWKKIRGYLGCSRNTWTKTTSVDLNSEFLLFS